VGRLADQALSSGSEIVVVAVAVLAGLYGVNAYLKRNDIGKASYGWGWQTTVGDATISAPVYDVVLCLAAA
jgi:hypothetical protein